MSKFTRRTSGVFVFYLGIDVGRTGAVALIGEDRMLYGLSDWIGGEVEMANRVEALIELASCEIDGRKPGASHGSIRIQVRAALERAQAMSKGGQAQGVTSMFNYGMNFGTWKGILAANKIPFELVHPRTWQKGIPGMSTKDKRVRKRCIAEQAQRLYPNAGVYGPRGGLLDGRADAVMIAEWRRNKE